MITQDQVKELFTYENGDLLWRKNPKGRKVKSPIAGTVNQSGYRVITIKGKKIHAHRLVWTYFNGWPEKSLDHIDRNPLNNKIENLRYCTHSENAQNCKIKLDNKSGVKGLSWCNTYNNWVMQIFKDGKKYTKRFSNFKDGKSYVEAFRNDLHGEFSCIG